MIVWHVEATTDTLYEGENGKVKNIHLIEIIL